MNWNVFDISKFRGCACSLENLLFWRGFLSADWLNFQKFLSLKFTDMNKIAWLERFSVLKYMHLITSIIKLWNINILCLKYFYIFFNIVLLTNLLISNLLLSFCTVKKFISQLNTFCNFQYSTLFNLLMLFVMFDILKSEGFYLVFFINISLLSQTYRICNIKYY